MLLRLPNNLHYPITVTKVEKRVGETVERNDKLFLYTYTTKVTEGSRDGENDKEVEKKFVEHFRSTLEGNVTSWRVWEGDVLHRPIDVVEIEEECPHTVQFQGMCTNCGRDMTTVEAGVTADIDRAPIRMDPNTQYLTISREEASRVDEEAKKRLLASRKLSLVVDLDQTIIHATVDPTIDEWRKDTENPNYDAVKDVRAFQLIDDGPGMRGCWYYIKLRPGLQEFLENVAQIYELYIYTMGTRQYAQQIAKLVDPDEKYFGERILSRDESGSMVVKNLERLFPVDTKMVVIIDDRGDVWKWNANLIRVTPFDFFVGIGDINSSFLPKKEEIQATLKPELPEVVNGEEGVNNGDINGSDSATENRPTLQNGTSALEQLVAMGGSDDPVVRELQSKEQEEILSTQLDDKPLEKMQREQDEKDEAEAAAAAAEQGGSIEISTNGETQTTIATESDSSESSESSFTSPGSGVRPRARHSILRNDDEELIHLEARLTAVHNAFFNEYDRKRMSGKGGRVAALSGGKKAPLPTSEEDIGSAELLLIPDIKKVMPAMKSRVLGSVTIVFSGVLPLGTDIQNADISTWAKTFGATITDKVSREVTHVIAARSGTAKVKQAIKRKIRVVGTPWLIESMQQWRRLDERPYLLEGAEKQASSDHGDDMINMTANDFLLSESDDMTGMDSEDDGDRPMRNRKRLKVDTARDEETDPEEAYDEKSPLTIEKSEWDDIDAELKEFMGSDVDSESDTESISSKLSVRNKQTVKRKRDDGPDDIADNGRVKRNASGSALRAVSNADAAIERAQREVEARQEAEEREELDSDDELAREMERELEQDDEEEGDSEGFMGAEGWVK